MSREWKLFFVTVAGACVLVAIVAGYAVRHSSKDHAITQVVITNVEFQNIMTGIFEVDGRSFSIREEVSPKFALPVGATTFVEYQISNPANARFTSYSSFGMAFVTLTCVFSFLLLFMSYVCWATATPEVSL